MSGMYIIILSITFIVSHEYKQASNILVVRKMVQKQTRNAYIVQLQWGSSLANRTH